MTATVAQCVIRIGDLAAHQIIAGRSRLHWLLRELIRFGVDDFLLLSAGTPIPADLSLPKPHTIRFVETSAQATAGALISAHNHLRDRFLLCDGTSWFDWNLAALLSDAAQDEPSVVGRITHEWKNNRSIGLFRKELLHHLKPESSLELDIIPNLASCGLVRRTIILNDDHPTAGSNFAAASPNPEPLRRHALFLDRDGVLNIDHGYVGSRDRFEWVEGALEAIRFATRAGWHVFIVTNQSGIARGLYSEQAVGSLHDWIADQARSIGGTIDDVRYCPFHPEATVDAYRKVHPWRKPQPGMLLDLIQAWDLDPSRAVMIGDQKTDMQAAVAAGVVGKLYIGGNLLDFIRPILDQHAMLTPF